MTAAEHYDVIIIGTGAGGGTLAHHLAPSGLRILLLERGDFVPREPENWSSRAVNVEGRYHTREVWRDRHGRPLHPHTSYCVGGNTKFFGAALFRLRERDFGELVHHGGVSPSWPISYADMEPYYARAERIYRVRGLRGEDPTEPATGRPYDHPPVSHEPRIQQLHDALAVQGLRPFHTPLGVMLDESDRRRSPCLRCGTCDGFPCKVRAKSDAEVCCVRPALSHGNVTLLTRAYVSHLETARGGRDIACVHVRRQVDGAMVFERYSADIVVASCGAINSAALLLRSVSDRHPRGLANGSDLVGRHYMGHTNSVLMAISRCANPTVFQKTLSVNDFYFGADDWRYPMGHISFVGKLDRDTLSAGAPRFVPGRVLDWMARHSLDFWLTSEDLPDPRNRVTIDRDGGIVLSYRPNNLEAHRRLAARLRRTLRSIRCSVHGRACHVGAFTRNLYVGERIPLAGVAHQNGTLRFGHDPRTSVLDVNCRAHEVDNLYVVDGSFFPSSGAVNPALTIAANALRVGDHLLERFGRRPAKERRALPVQAGTVPS